jgi:hypothetical protein
MTPETDRPSCPPRDGECPPPSRQAPALWRDGTTAHIDVRGMVPPQPLVAILRLVRSMPPAQIVAHLDRDPVMLYPELAELGWEASPLPGDAGEVRLLLRRVA